MTPIISPTLSPFQRFNDETEAIDFLHKLYSRSIQHIQHHFQRYLMGYIPNGRVRAYYPAIRLHIPSHQTVDSRLAFGYLSEPGTYETSITNPLLFNDYLKEQLRLIMCNHDIDIEIGESKQTIPLHFALDNALNQSVTHLSQTSYRDYFDVPDLSTINDDIVNGEWSGTANTFKPLAPFTAQRIDYSLQRLKHYTATSPQYFQNYILFTNYQFYVDKFCELAKTLVNDKNTGYTAFIEPGDLQYTLEGRHGNSPVRNPQMPAYHLIKDKHAGITLVNIGVGPSNAKTITDHIAVLRPHAWLMLGHCAGLRASQNLGDYVLAHAYMREDHVLDQDLPTWIPVPALAEIQIALEKAVAHITQLEDWELKRIMRTGTVASTDNRNWELQNHDKLIREFNQSRAIALDMESATVAANGFRFRVPYGTLLCVSDKPLHGELKLPSMATTFYQQQVDQHLLIGLKALEYLSAMPTERLHSRKLRGVLETAFQ